MSESFGAGMFVTVFVVIFAALIAVTSYELGQKSVIKEVKHYGCEKAVSFHEVKP